MREPLSSAPKVVFVHDLRPPPWLDDELDWFFNRAESDMGHSSNFRACLGLEAESVSLDDAAEASLRHRNLRIVMKSIPDRDAGVLQAAYELRAWPVALYDALGRVTGVLVRLACVKDDWPASRLAQQRLEIARANALVDSGVIGRRDPSFVELRREAELLFARAHNRYRAAREARS